MHTHIIILKKLKSSPLTKIQLFLGEHILKALMISEHIYLNTIQVVSPDLECKHHYCKLEVMSWIVLLMDLILSIIIRYNVISLHQHNLGQLWIYRNRSHNHMNPLVQSRKDFWSS